MLLVLEICSNAFKLIYCLVCCISEFLYPKQSYALHLHAGSFNYVSKTSVHSSRQAKKLEGRWRKRDNSWVYLKYYFPEAVRILPQTIMNVSLIYCLAKIKVHWYRYPMPFNLILFWSLLFQVTCKQVQQPALERTVKYFLAYVMGVIPLGKDCFQAYHNQGNGCSRNYLQRWHAKLKVSIQTFGQNDTAIKNSIDKAWVSYYILNWICLKAVLEK